MNKYSPQSYSWEEEGRFLICHFDGKEVARIIYIKKVFKAKVIGYRGKNGGYFSLEAQTSWDAKLEVVYDYLMKG